MADNWMARHPDVVRQLQEYVVAQFRAACQFKDTGKSTETVDIGALLTKAYEAGLADGRAHAEEVAPR